jgi:hypothetical protein
MGHMGVALRHDIAEGGLSVVRVESFLALQYLLVC